VSLRVWIVAAATMTTFDPDRLISSKDMKRCFEALEAEYGKSTISTVVHELEIMFGVVLTGSLKYKISEIDVALRKLLGDSAGEIMMDSILKHLRR
jgi:hypothetical protein